MPPKRKRKASVEDEPPKRGKREVSRKSSVIDELNKPFSVKRCKSWFQHYAGKDEPDVVGPEGIEKLCKDLAVDPENIVMLVLAWKLDAETMGFFKFNEWCKGMGLIECDSTAKLHAKLSSLRLLIHDFSTFKKIYRYAFDFCRNKDQRSLDIETAKAMLKLLLENSWTLLDSFLDFLLQSKYKVINKDQWCNVLEFSRSIKSDLSNYDEDGAWPVMLDEFVEWYKSR